jgi:hypothetical protein
VDYTYSEGQTWGDPTPAPQNDVVVQTTTAAAVVAPSTPAPQPASTPSSTPAASPAPSPATSSAAPPAASPASDVLVANDASSLLSLGFSALGLNSHDSSAGVWIGDDGPYTNQFINSAGEDLVLVIWGAVASWVNANTPLITLSLPVGSTVTISFADGQSGAWAPLFADTQLVNGQVCQTWGEYTFDPEGVVDVSREVNMNGRGMSIVGPSCTTDMTTCVFECADPSVTSCETGYELLNCTPGSQPGAQYGTYGGAASGGCGWLGASSVQLTTTFT